MKMKPNPNGLGGMQIDIPALCEEWGIPHPQLQDQHGRPCYLPDGTEIKYDDGKWWQFWKGPEAYSPVKHGSLDWKRP